MGRGRGTEKKNTGGIIGRGYTISSPLLLRSFLLSLSLSSSNGAPLTKETCSLQAHVHLLRDDALLTILGQDSLSLTFSFNVYVHVYIYICISFFLSARRSLSTIRFHERDARVACILRTVDFAVSRVKDNQPPLRTTPPPGSFLDCWLTACCHVATPRPKGIGRRARRAGNSNSSPFLFVSLFGANCSYIYICISTL